MSKRACLAAIGLVFAVVFSVAAPACADQPAVVAIIKGQDPNVMVAQAIEAVGGLKDIIHDGQNVVIKPNLTYMMDDQYCPGMTTDVRVAAAVVEQIKKTAACKLAFADGCGMPAKRMFEKCGYADLAAKNDIKLVDLAQDQFEPVKVDGLAFKEYQYPQTMRNADVLIDLPILKTHQLTGITVGMKNLFGLLPPPRDPFHDRADEVLCDLLQIHKPDLVLVDGLIGMEGQGPIWGEAVKMNLIIAGRDVVAVDTVCAAIMGFDPNRVQHIRHAAQKGLGQNDLGKITIRGSSIDEVKRSFRPARWFVKMELPRNDKLVAKLLASADSLTEIKESKKNGKAANFVASRLTVDKEKYPLRESFGFKAEILDGVDTVSFEVRYVALYQETRPAAQEEMIAWIKANLSDVNADEPKVLPMGGEWPKKK